MDDDPNLDTSVDINLDESINFKLDAIVNFNCDARFNLSHKLSKGNISPVFCIEFLIL